MSLFHQTVCHSDYDFLMAPHSLLLLLLLVLVLVLKLYPLL
jgi:hypothetical protein